MRNMAVLHSPAFSYPLPVLVRVLFNLLIFKGKILYYNKDIKIITEIHITTETLCVKYKNRLMASDSVKVFNKVFHQYPRIQI